VPRTGEAKRFDDKVVFAVRGEEDLRSGTDRQLDREVARRRLRAAPSCAPRRALFRRNPSGSCGRESQAQSIFDTALLQDLSAAMALLGMIAVDLFACVPDLLDDEEGVAALHDLFDLGIFVPWNEHEVEALPDYAFVIGRTHVDRVHAGGASAFTVEPQRRLDAMSFGSLLDPFVHVAEDLLVPGGSLREVHGSSAPDE
jgi:hypothetical protein